MLSTVPLLGGACACAPDGDECEAQFRAYMPLNVLLRSGMHDFEPMLPMLQQYDSFGDAEAPERAALLLNVRAPDSESRQQDWSITFTAGGKTYMAFAGGLAASVTHALGMNHTEIGRLFVPLNGAEVPLKDIFTASAPAPFNSLTPSFATRPPPHLNAGAGADAPEQRARHQAPSSMANSYAVPADQFALLPRAPEFDAPGDFAFNQSQASEALRRVIAALEEERSRWAAQMEHMLASVRESTLALRQARALTACAADRRLAVRLYDHALSGRAPGWFCGDAYDWRLATELVRVVPKVVEVFIGAADPPDPPDPLDHPGIGSPKPPESRCKTVHRSHCGHRSAVLCEWAARLGDCGWHHPCSVAAKARGAYAVIWLIALSAQGQATQLRPTPALRIHFF